MKLKILKGFTHEIKGVKWLVLRLDDSHNHLLDKLNKTLENEEISVTLDKWRNARSLTANAYAWTLIHQLAIKLNRTDEEIYLIMLDRYGVHEYVGCLPEAVPSLEKICKFIKIKGDIDLNGKQGVTVKCTIGSSNYNSKQMSTFIEGIVQDCKDQGIDTMTPQEIQQLINTQKMIESEG